MYFEFLVSAFCLPLRGSRESRANLFLPMVVHAITSTYVINSPPVSASLKTTYMAYGHRLQASKQAVTEHEL